MKKHFVTFLSPGTFFHEESEYPVDSWNVDSACEMAHDIVDRHGARPFAFYFTTRERKDSELDSKVSKKSGRFFLGGKLLTSNDIVKMSKEDGKNYSTLLNNMKFNNWPRVVMNDNSWRIFQPLEKDDVILDFKMKPKKQKAA